MPSKVGNLCGILAPFWWACAIIIFGALRPEHSHFTQYISELGERGSSTEHAMRYAGFLPTGLMHIAFAAFLYFTFKGSWIAAIAAALVAMNGLGRIGAGLFPCEPGCLGPSPLHSFSATVGFFALIGASILWGIFMRRHPSLRGFGLYSIGSGMAGLVFLLLMVWSDPARAGTGLYERLASGLLSLWVLMFAVRLWRGADKQATAVPPLP